MKAISKVKSLLLVPLKAFVCHSWYQIDIPDEVHLKQDIFENLKVPKSVDNDDGIL